jgi:hypothetical protein
MQIRFIDPFSRGWGRMKKALFQPFNLKKWFLVGFTAFLAGLADCHNGGGNNSGGRGSSHWDWGDVLGFPREAWQWLTDNPGWFTLIVMGILLIFAIGILLTWLSSRGKFMFLDNVVHDRAEVSKPWQEFRAQGTSLFVWRFCFGLIVFIAIAAYLFMCFLVFSGLHEGDAPEQVYIITAIWMVLGFFALVIISAYIDLFLDSFVVPIMYKNKISAVQGWRQFRKIFSSHVMHFIGYGLFNFFVMLLVVIGVIIICFLTCCIGFVLLIIPYINSVALLPVSYTFRAFSVEFLEQFGKDYYLFPRPKPRTSKAVKK